MRRLLAVIPLMIILGAGALALRGRWPWHRLQSATPIEVTQAFTQSADTLHQGETLSDLFARNGVGQLAISALTTANLLDPRRIRAGLVFNFTQSLADSEPSRVQFRTDPETRVFLRRQADGWDASSEAIPWSPEVVRVDGDIDQSLYVALDDHVPDQVLPPDERVRLAWDLADTYMWEVDFTRDIRPGDHFNVLVERQVSEDGEVRFGKILAADLRISGRDLPAFRFTDSHGKVAFYDSKGESLRRAFLRAPLQFRRISSSFSLSRFHPILQRWRAHTGTDYAAAAGTPVMAAGDGTVLRAGRYGGYGNLIELRHANGITTRYGHLSRFAAGIRPGIRVSQGQIIGYVGMTGLATAPHLHYEFRVNGVPRDSRRIDPGNGKPIPSSERAAFDQERDRLAALLYPLQPTVVAGPVAQK